MRAPFSVALLLLTSVAMAGAQAPGKTGARSNGLSVREFRDFARSLPELPGRIQAIRLFEASGGQTSSVAVATWGERSGWQLFVFGSQAGQNFRLEWTSGKLDDSFAVSWAGALRAFTFGDGEQAIQFSGCAPHLCPDSVFSILLYVPSRRTAFTARYVWGKVTYSPSLESSGNRPYKDALAQLVKEHRNQ